MAPAASMLPTRFPCWCKAVYSWGGETKRDLGFIEGDLIECLNAGDGSWWMGRLKRDRRMVGLFPSNFVEVLDESFQPGSRSVSPLPSRNGSTLSTASAGPTPAPQKQKSVFRKPFQAYASAQSPNPAAAAREVKSKGGSINGTPPGSVSKRTPYSSLKKPHNDGTPTSLQKFERPSDFSRFRAVSPRPASRSNTQSQMRARSPAPPVSYHNQSHSRAASPMPMYQDHSRGPSPSPYQYESHSRGPSPSPYQTQQHISRAPSPNPHAYHHSRAPSPNPQAYHHSRAPSPNPQAYHHSRAPSPNPHAYHSRAPSPNPHAYHSRAPSPNPQAYHSRAPSPNPYADGMSPPPPAPPPHRNAYNHSRAPSPQPYGYEHDQSQNLGGYHTPAPPSPMPGSPGGTGLTPSPLTNAMNDVMSSLQGMGVQRSPSPEEPKTPPSIWSPEAFGQSFMQTSKPGRAATSMGMTGMDSGYGSQNTDEFSQSTRGVDDGPPEIHNYVQRMESRLRKMQDEQLQDPQPDDEDNGPPPPSKDDRYTNGSGTPVKNGSKRLLKNRKSAYELGRHVLDRTFTTKTNATNSTNSSNTTHHSLMSGYSATAMSATSAGSMHRKRFGLGGSVKDKSGNRPVSVMEGRSTSRLAFFGSASRPQTPSTGISYHSSHNSSRQGAQSSMDWVGDVNNESAGVFGGLSTPKPRKSGFFKRMADTVKTGAATARSTVASRSRPGSPVKGMGPNGVTSIAGGLGGGLGGGISGGKATPTPGSAARDMGLGGGVDWVQVRRDINRSNSISRNERSERAERCQMLDMPVLDPIAELYNTAEGDEGLDGLPVPEPTDFTIAANLALVDKSARFVQNIPAHTTPAGLAQGYVCRPYRSDVQRLRAIFTWASERVCWEEDFEGPADARRVIQTKRGCSEEIATLVTEMCASLGIYCEVVRGYLKSPGEILDFDMVARPNHFWNAVIVDGEWRFMDCALANASNPKRAAYSTTGSSAAESWWFLTRPMEICYTHVPLLPEQQHIVPPLPHEVLMALPCACPPYFKHGVQIVDFDTSLLNLENLEMVHVHVEVPEDVECVAEVEARAFAQDADGDFFESGDLVKKKALAQAEWVGGRKRYTIKGLLPGDEGQGILKVYAGKRGLMHSITSNPHALAIAFPITHTGTNPPYSFLTLHPTPHAQRHDLYVAQPQCHRLAVNNTFVFCVRQHPSSMYQESPNPGRAPSPNPYMRPTSAMSMASISASGSSYSNPSNASSSSDPSGQKPAKLAIQSPAGKIIRLLRKQEISSAGREQGDGTSWETVIKVSERGIWRGLVLADRSARWCVFGEWECV